MSAKQFGAIIACLCLCTSAPPAHIDPLWEVQGMLEAWNANVMNTFLAAWISCLDESMLKWNNQCTCPGFIMCPPKPWPLGNECHAMACGISGILHAMEIVEGKDEP